MNHLTHARAGSAKFTAPPDSTRLTTLIDSITAADQLQSMQASRQKAQIEAQAAKLKEQGQRIDAYEKSLNHQRQLNSVLQSKLQGALENLARMQAYLTPTTIDADVVRTITVDGADYMCGFDYQGEVDYQSGTVNAELECTEIWAIGAVDISQYAPDYLTKACEKAAEKQRSEEF